jgi:peptidoglycan/LPS O-acetylase OafA/YrhL
MAKHFKALDGIRGLAAVAVLLHHLGKMTAAPWLSPYGYLAVDLFFLLSGFVIAAAYERRLAAGLHPVKYIFEIRVARMYPMILLGTFLGLASALAGARITAEPVSLALKQLVLLPTFSGVDLFFLNTVMWSLMLELWINAAHAFAFRWLSAKVLITVAAVGAVGVVVASWPYYGLNAGWNAKTAIGGLPRVLFSFSAGLLLYRLYASGRLPNFRIPFAVSFSLLAIAMLVPLPNEKHHIPALHDLMAVLVIFPLAIIGGVNANLSTRASRVATVLGDLSYPLYAIHFPLIVFSIFMVGGRSVSAPFYWQLWLPFCIVVVALAWVIDQIVEKPFQRWWRSRQTARSTVARAAA